VSNPFRLYLLLFVSVTFQCNRITIKITNYSFTTNIHLRIVCQVVPAGNISVIFGGSMEIPHIQLNDTGKRFGREWIFRHVNLSLAPGERMAVLGGNGSGKSTLLQVIAGFIVPAEGSVSYTALGRAIDPDSVPALLSYASPYLQVHEDLTIGELFAHVSVRRRFYTGPAADDFIEKAGLAHAKGKYIRQFSSGMKQRLKLALAVLCDTPVLLLDEPLSNLDRAGMQWYQNIMTQHADNRTVVVCSNEMQEEYFLCTRTLSVHDLKPVT
jgi:ABC-2 type transport system ATP-binding protein